MELGMSALLAAAFAYRNVISLVCVGFVAIGMASAPETCARLWRILVRNAKLLSTCGVDNDLFSGVIALSCPDAGPCGSSCRSAGVLSPLLSKP